MKCRLLNISEATNLAIHAMRYLSMTGEKLGAAELAKVLHASPHHLSKVLRRLVVAGLVSVEKGPEGGFHLTEKQNQTNLMKIYKAIEGETDFDVCLLENPLCGMEHCIFGSLLKNVKREFVECLESTKISYDNFIKETTAKN